MSWCGVLDGGGTKTQVALAARDGKVRIGPVRAGCNAQDNPAWEGTLRAALADLAGAESAVLGLPGYGEVATLDTAADTVVAQCRPGDLVVNDVALALRAAYPVGGGVLLLAGTGSMAMAEGNAGIVRTGGWGNTFGDEGSAFDIGRRALSLASREIDGWASSTGFAGRLSEAIGVGEGHFALLAWTVEAAHPRSAVAGVARVVDGLAQAGEHVAIGLLRDAAEDLATLAETAARRAGLSDWGWTAGGSVFASETVLGAVTERIGPPEARRTSPLAGGLAWAAERAGWDIDDAWRATVARDLDERLKETGPA
ncbi:N-acetylglucosamine kinase [Pelagovum pacificum]|uniref:N-acetylglucosamine kinase n=1 Tax=Pelagovum pacificum TaxID=2588711 RepID=UPI0018CE0BF4|nr:BadF/BadG/BcrA/BcrD ATPase family protein [Pelagovum pacificum]QQA44280.1 hypothetical protein I8N54_06790 [Pelagovum pacificum]